MAKVLRNFNVFAGDDSYFGKASEVNAPNIEFVVEAFQNAGQVMKTEEVMGLEMMVLELTFRDPCPKLVSYLGNPEAQEEPITIRGAVTEKGVTQKVEIKANGLWKSMESSAFTAGGAEYTNKFSVTLDYYQYSVDNKEVFFADDAAGIIRVGNKDITKDIRDALGV